MTTRYMDDPGSWRSFVEKVQRGEVKAPFAEHVARFRAPGAHQRGDVPPIAWWPDERMREASNLLNLMRELELSSYEELHRFSVENREGFWRRVLDRLGVIWKTRPASILELSRGPREPRWLSGAELNITESCFRSAPERTAIVHGRERDGKIDATTYGQLEAAVRQFASGLRAHGYGPDDAIALYTPMTPQCVVAYLGTIRAGCRVVSIPDSFSSEELAKRTRIANARAIVTQASYTRAGRAISLYPRVREAIAESDSEIRAIVVEPGKLEGADLGWEQFLSSEETESYAASPEHVTGVLFSSGTTRTPKAIPWTQLTPLKSGMDAHFHHDVHPEDVVCWPTNVGWMMGPWLIYASLLNRATMALYEGTPSGEGYTRFVRDAAVTILGVVPSMVRSWRANESVRAGEWSGVRLFSSTGEASATEEYLWLMSRADYRAPVIEYLGGTEIGGGHLTGTVLQPASPSTFTTPALGIDFVILDELGHPVPEGESGELFLIPPSLGLSQSLLNADHDAIYYDDCPSGPNGEVLRRHGDQVRRLPGGYYKAEGRCDDTMNLGGIKVGSLEIERVVNAHPAVHESAAIGVVPGGEGAERLVLYVVANGGVERERLKKELAKSLADRMSPLFKIHDLVLVETLPRTPSNKIMRRELRASYRPHDQRF